MSVAINHLLRNIAPYLSKDDTNEITINQPGEFIVETASSKEWHTDKSLDFNTLKQLASLVASNSDQTISKAMPLLSATLPTGERIQIVMPPSVDKNMFGVSIRKPSVKKYSLEEYEKMGFFDKLDNPSFKSQKAVLADLKALKAERRYADFWKLAVRSRQNIIVSGGTSSSKTTFINSLMEYIPDNERIISIEDAREVQISQRDKLHLLTSKGDQGVAKVTMQNLLEACLRLNPDRIMLSELRGEEAYYFIRAVNSDHPGSMTTLHANSVDGAFSQMVMMIKQGNSGLDESSIRSYLKSAINIVVQLNKSSEGLRAMTELWINEDC